MSSTLKHLEELGLIERTASSSDARVQLLNTTLEAQRHIGRIREHFAHLLLESAVLRDLDLHDTTAKLSRLTEELTGGR